LIRTRPGPRARTPGDWKAEVDIAGPYPESTVIGRSNLTSRVFNVRLTEEQFAAIQEIAGSQHLPMSTMARAWLLDRLDEERRAS
jgi:hypothetical protein